MPKYSYLEISCCLLLADWLCWFRKILVLCGRDQGTVEVVNIFCLTHCLLCSPQNVFQNIQIHSSQFISTSYLSKKVFFKTMDNIFQFIVVTFLWDQDSVVSQWLKYANKQFLASKISFCLLYLHVFVSTKM